MKRAYMFLIVAILATNILSAQYKTGDYLNKRWKDVATKMPDKWYASDEAKFVAENVLLAQKEIGGWEKNKAYHHPFSESEKEHYVNDKSEIGATFDNSATITELRFLAKIYAQVKDERYQQAFDKGINYIFISQYENGGWPQYYPLRSGYYSRITYNDDAMVNILKFLDEIISDNAEFAALQTGKKYKTKAKRAFDAGIECILKTQIIVDGKPTVWCAQYDEVTLEPAKARSYELPSFSGSESVGITMLLMNIKNPSAEIINAVNGAVQWFENNGIAGIKLERTTNQNGEKDRIVVKDKNAPTLWGRFHDLETGKPFFCSRDGIKKNSLAEISHERRNGYSWYTNSPERVLKAYPKWLQKINTPLLSVAENQRFLMTKNGEPFFWLGDTGWLLFSKLDRKEAEKYLDNRAKNGFNVIQVMVLHSLELTNVYGDSALIQGDISLPKITEGNSFENKDEYDYWDHVDFIVDLAENKGIYMGMVPVWGSNVRGGKVSINKAEKYATWLAKRYSNKSNIIWLNGGDTKGSENTAIWNIIGQCLRENAPDHLITFHPFGRTKSSSWFHAAEWLDFNMFQSGHRRYDQDDTELAYGQDNWKYVRDDYSLTPVKPTIDGEPSYEGIPQGLHDPVEPYWNANDVRRYAYWSVFAGAFGFTYGHSAVMQMHKPGNSSPSYGVREYWTEAINATGATQMKHLKHLMLSKPFFERVPDQSFIASGQGKQYDYQVATRGAEYAFIYTYNGREIQIAMGKIQGSKISASWYNPRNGKTVLIGEFENKGTRTFNPPGEIQDGNDWVLVLESAK